jgi:hypothetical protein
MPNSAYRRNSCPDSCHVVRGRCVVTRGAMVYNGTGRLAYQRCSGDATEGPRQGLHGMYTSARQVTGNKDLPRLAVPSSTQWLRDSGSERAVLPHAKGGESPSSAHRSSMSSSTTVNPMARPLLDVRLSRYIRRAKALRCSKVKSMYRWWLPRTEPIDHLPSCIIAVSDSPTSAAQVAAPRRIE